MDDFGIAGKRALVTGGGRGFGLAIAKKLLELGATVYIADWNKELLDKAVSDTGNKLIPLEVDVSKWNDTREVLKNVLPIQLLVNNAGILVIKSALEFTEEDYYRTMDINLKAVLNLTQFVAENLVNKNMHGSIVNISSQFSTTAVPNSLVYSASKAAVSMATKCFALELGPKNIRVNAVNPTMAETDMGRQVLSKPEIHAYIKSRIPIGRLAVPDDVANAVVFLLSNKSEMITGHCLYVDGGYTTA